MKAKKEDKFIVLKRKDVDDYFEQFTKGIYTSEEEKKVLDKVPFVDVVNSICVKDNKYIVINQDEPYADLIWQIILMGEDAKQAK